MKNGYYAMSLLLALGLSVTACGDGERREEPMSRAPSESIAPPAAPEAQRPSEGSGIPPAAEQEQRERAQQPTQEGSSS